MILFQIFIHLVGGIPQLNIIIIIKIIYDNVTSGIDHQTLGIAYIKNKNMDEIVISLYFDESTNGNKYLIAPANTLEEALNIYNDIKENNIK